MGKSKLICYLTENRDTENKRVDCLNQILWGGIKYKGLGWVSGEIQSVTVSR